MFSLQVLYSIGCVYDPLDESMINDSHSAILLVLKRVEGKEKVNEKDSCRLACYTLE